MSPAKLIRWSAGSTMLGGLLIAVFPFLHPNHDPAGYQSAAWVPAHLMPHIGLLLVLLGLIGLLAWGLYRTRLGVLGFLAAFVGTALFQTQATSETFDLPFVALAAPQLMDGPPPGLPYLLFVSACFSLGYLLLGAAIVRTGRLPHVAGLLVAASGIILGFGGPLAPPWVFTIGAVVFGAGLVWLGSVLWRLSSEGLPASPSSTAGVRVPR